MFSSKMKPKITIHETAFVTSVFRASDETVSKDVYAKFWPSKKTTKHAERYTKNVSVYEPLAHCLRNRYFLEKIAELHTMNKIKILINFGCGFSMYPFLLDKHLHHNEIDQQDVIAYKSKNIAFWQSIGKLPKRNIQYIVSNFNNDNFESLLLRIESIKKDRPSFILIEGVLFFLGKNNTDRLFKLFDALQGSNEYIGSVSFQESLKATPVFQKMIDFVEKNLEKNQQFHYQMIDDSYYEQLINYRLIDHQNTLSMASTYAPDKVIEKDKILNEHSYLLKKKSIT